MATKTPQRAKDLAYYMSLPYTYQVRPAENADGPYWAARVAEVPRISGGGDTPTAAIESVKTSLELWIEDAIEDGAEIPEPAPEAGFSGKFALRMPKALHRDVTARADREGVSLNAWINTVVAQHGT
jgi:predicted HicB family RNase H-like nuclease